MQFRNLRQSNYRRLCVSCTCVPRTDGRVGGGGRHSNSNRESGLRVRAPPRPHPVRPRQPTYELRRRDGTYVRFRVPLPCLPAAPQPACFIQAGPLEVEIVCLVTLVAPVHALLSLLCSSPLHNHKTSCCTFWLVGITRRESEYDMT